MVNLLFGAIGGDICGSFYEARYCKTKDISNIQLIKTANDFTDDTVCTIGVADTLINCPNPTVEDFRDYIQKWCKKYTGRGYGGMFKDWILNPVPYNSYGNGSAMRVSPIGFFSKTEEECVKLATLSASCSHNHKEGIKGAVAIALCIFHSLRNADKEEVRKILKLYYPEWGDKTLDEIRPNYHFDSTCQGSVPVAIIAFLESSSYTDCLKLAISTGGDSDTLAAMAGGIAYAYYRGTGTMPKLLVDNIIEILPQEMLSVCRNFDKIANEHLHMPVRKHLL